MTVGGRLNLRYPHRVPILFEPMSAQATSDATISVAVNDVAFDKAARSKAAC
jgi:hypothetical protein